MPKYGDLLASKKTSLSFLGFVSMNLLFYFNKLFVGTISCLLMFLFFLCNSLNVLPFTFSDQARALHVLVLLVFE